MTRRRTARELEGAAARRSPPARAPAVAAGTAAPPEPLAMLVRRGLRPRPITPDLPFPRDVEDRVADRLAERLSHYAFRLFLRGAILARAPFRPEAATQYVPRPQAARMAAELVRLGLAEPAGRGRFRLVHPAANFGGTLE
jgi:hypothetical protein